MNVAGVRFYRVSLFALSVLILGGCVSRPLPVEDDSAWSMVGKLGIVAEGQRGSYTILWRQEGSNFDIRLVGTLGIGGATIQGRPGAVTLEATGQPPVEAADVQTLVVATLGYDLPVEPMRYWVRGERAPGAAQPAPDGFRQFGWHVQLLEMAEGLPVRIRLVRPEARLTLAVKEWQG